MAYFNNAATTYPKPECVYKAMADFGSQYVGSSDRGGGAKSVGKLISDTRSLLKELFHTHNHEVIFTPTATLALNMIIQGLVVSGRKNIYITPFEHNAVTRVLHGLGKMYELKVQELKVKHDYTYDLERIGYQFSEVKPDVVIVSHASNVFGLVAPADEIFSLSKKYQAVNVLDMSQTAGLIDTDLGNLNCDCAVFAGHKTLYGPTGISGFLLNPNIALTPVIYGGTGVDSANQDMPRELPSRYEMGTMNAWGIAGLHAALTWLKETGIEHIHKLEQINRGKLLDILGEYEFIQLVGINPDCEYVGVVSMLIDGISSDSAASIFDRLGIDVRTGLQCAPYAHKFLGTFPAGTIRLSVGYFTSDEDFQKLRDALDYIGDNL
ncbi:cysteine desulfurase family protein [Anaerovibrio lipolyticus DSM 3074]|uniref:Cysteine desulfurase family protein n=1 Tax=Anaerovibrio lipolyticus DSM 3074 TaxID=1120997 RepID=A0A1M6BWC0_9FIRM|nr:aminotransferase class V-fold PLP-dependent enzyme [Anaerovibrio lipolyticus]SHI53049.1 cysteine desulfurase family protein [Anaerovibrio lipolyticus DSM 3074]